MPLRDWLCESPSFQSKKSSGKRAVCVLSLFKGHGLVWQKKCGGFVSAWGSLGFQEKGAGQNVCVFVRVRVSNRYHPREALYPLLFFRGFYFPFCSKCCCM